jgi:predicted XRE-type DNA-binding protein
MKKQSKFPRAKTAQELAALLGLSDEEAVELELRSSLNAKIIEVVKKRGLTHEAVAKLAGTSRTRVTALLNCNTRNVSTALMIRILAALGIRVRVTYSAMKLAA